MSNLLCALLYGILEGITEWLPISSTGHLILLDRYLSLPLSPTAAEVFFVVIQLGAILAVVVVFFDTLNPFGRKKSKQERKRTIFLWGKVLLATLPCAVIGLLFDDLLDAYLYTPLVVAIALLFYGVAFLLLERRKTSPIVGDVSAIPTKTAFFVGCFQLLSLVPGTSRSGATILGGIALALPRPVAAEFSFFLGIPTMLGAGLLKLFKFFTEGNRFLQGELLVVGVGTLSAFLVSLLTIRFLVGFVRRHSFAAFGIYRILLGLAVLADILL